MTQRQRGKERTWKEANLNWIYASGLSHYPGRKSEEFQWNRSQDEAHQKHTHLIIFQCDVVLAYTYTECSNAVPCTKLLFYYSFFKNIKLISLDINQGETAGLGLNAKIFKWLTADSKQTMHWMLKIVIYIQSESHVHAGTGIWCRCYHNNKLMNPVRISSSWSCFRMTAMFSTVVLEF